MTQIRIDRAQIARLFALAAYLVYSASGLLLVSFCPRVLLPEFLTLYPVVNSVASFGIMLFYTNARSRPVDIIIAVLTAATTAAFLAGGSLPLLLCAYVVISVVLDYSAAQSFSIARQSQIRLVLALCTAVLPFHFFAFLVLRTAVSLAVFGLSIAQKNYDAPGYRPPLAKALVLLALNLIYFAPLYAVGAYLVAAKRIGYLIYAVVANILVRTMDFEAKLIVSGEGKGHPVIFHAVLGAGIVAVGAFAALVTPAYGLMAIPLVLIAVCRTRYIRLTWS